MLPHLLPISANLILPSPAKLQISKRSPGAIFFCGCGFFVYLLFFSAAELSSSSELVLQIWFMYIVDFTEMVPSANLSAVLSNMNIEVPSISAVSTNYVSVKERWNKTWDEGRYSWVHKYGKSSSGEHWDTHVQQDTWLKNTLIMVFTIAIKTSCLYVKSKNHLRVNSAQRCNGDSLYELAAKRCNSGGLLWFRLSGGSQRHSGAPVAGVGEVMFEEEDEGVACDVRLGLFDGYPLISIEDSLDVYVGLRIAIYNLSSSYFIKSTFT
ncbi:hypothetical protein L2E82_22673 [Cichorium intybus]|uniref:Uncharacterized protein n=1 Tax=Cichorium intybus TaxID=13427 RepID=A0ACB9DY00_CICIN|nr:hypothetical protein L2E82_22673 [Cichorium intybus]